jgi:hypothetical protein
MEKPLTIRIKEIEEQIVKVVNESGLPPYVLLNITNDISTQLQDIISKEEVEYLREQNMEQVKKTKRGDK